MFSLMLLQREFSESSVLHLIPELPPAASPAASPCPYKPYGPRQGRAPFCSQLFLCHQKGPEGSECLAGLGHHGQGPPGTARGTQGPGQAEGDAGHSRGESRDVPAACSSQDKGHRALLQTGVMGMLPRLELLCSGWES